MWVDDRGSLSTVYNDGETKTCGWIVRAHSIRSTGKSHMWSELTTPDDQEVDMVI